MQEPGLSKDCVVFEELRCRSNKDLPTIRTGWQDVSTKEAEWTLLMQSATGTFNNLECSKVQQMIGAGPRKKTSETVTYAARVLEEKHQDARAVKSRRKKKSNNSKLKGCWRRLHPRQEMQDNAGEHASV